MKYIELTARLIVHDATPKQALDNIRHFASQGYDMYIFDPTIEFYNTDCLPLLKELLKDSDAVIVYGHIINEF